MKHSQARRDITSLLRVHGQRQGPLTSWVSLENFQWKAPRRHPVKKPKTPGHKGPVPLPQAPVSKAEPGHPRKDIHFSCLSSISHYFGSLLKALEGWNVERQVIWKLCLEAQPIKSVATPHWNKAQFSLKGVDLLWSISAVLGLLENNKDHLNKFNKMMNTQNSNK